MSAIGSLVFCTDCGNLLDSTTGRAESILTCACCGAQNKGSTFPPFHLSSKCKANTLLSCFPDTASTTITTTSKGTSFPSILRQKRSAIQTVKRDDLQTDAVIAETCPKCNAKEVRWSQAQLRGADEGSTIFYTCFNPECGNK